MSTTSIHHCDTESANPDALILLYLQQIIISRHQIRSFCRQCTGDNAVVIGVAAMAFLDYRNGLIG